VNKEKKNQKNNKKEEHEKKKDANRILIPFNVSAEEALEAVKKYLDITGEKKEGKN
jgi:pyruvate/2-oxoacid:ferredoxin oxidoreductase alpha subunit